MSPPAADQPACGVYLATDRRLVAFSDRPDPLRIRGEIVREVCDACARELQIPQVNA